MIHQNDKEAHTIHQNDKEAHPTIKDYGCYYYSLLTELFRRFPNLGELTHQFAYDFWIQELNNNRADIRSDCLIENPQNLVDDLVGPGKVIFIGKMDKTYKPSASDIVIQYWEYYDSNNKLSGTHFTLQDYDPWYPASPWKTNGKLMGYRIYRIKE